VEEERRRRKTKKKDKVTSWQDMTNKDLQKVRKIIRYRQSVALR